MTTVRPILVFLLVSLTGACDERACESTDDCVPTEQCVEGLCAPRADRSADPPEPDPVDEQPTACARDDECGGGVCLDALCVAVPPAEQLPDPPVVGDPCGGDEGASGRCAPEDGEAQPAPVEPLVCTEELRAEGRCSAPDPDDEDNTPPPSCAEPDEDGRCPAA